MAERRPSFPFQLRSAADLSLFNIDYALSRSVQVLSRRPTPTPGGIWTVIDELGKEAAGKNLRFEDYVDMRALRELEKEAFFK